MSRTSLRKGFLAFFACLAISLSCRRSSRSKCFQTLTIDSLVCCRARRCKLLLSASAFFNLSVTPSACASASDGLMLLLVSVTIWVVSSFKSALFASQLVIWRFPAMGTISKSKGDQTQFTGCEVRNTCAYMRVDEHEYEHEYAHEYQYAHGNDHEHPHRMIMNMITNINTSINSKINTYMHRHGTCMRQSQPYIHIYTYIHI